MEIIGVHNITIDENLNSLIIKIIKLQTSLFEGNN